MLLEAIMKCIALATRFGQEEISWHVQSQLLTFFAKSALEGLKTQITQFCDTLQSGNSIYFQEGVNHIYIQKLDTNCCAVICDVELSVQQMQHLSLYLFSQHIPLKNIASNLENYTQDFKTQKINDELAAVLEVMKQNLEKVLARDSKIEDLEDKARQLKETSLQFQRTVHETTSSCWPSICNIL